MVKTKIVGLGLVLALVATALVAAGGATSATAESGQFGAARYAGGIVVPGWTGRFKKPLVKVGTIVTIGLPASDQRSTAAVLVAAARAMNRSGGLHGHPLGVVVCNDRNDPNEAAACGRKMVESNVVAVIAGQSVSGDGQIQQILQAAGIPWIAPNPVAFAMFSAPNVYLPQVPTLFQLQALVAYAAHHNWRPIAWAASDIPAGRTFASTIENVLKPINRGEGFSPQVYVSPTASDFAPYAASLNRGNPVSCLCSLGNGQLWPMYSALERQGSSVKHYMQGGTFKLADVIGLGKGGDKVRAALTYPPYSHPTMQKFVRDLAAERKRGNRDANLTTIDPRAIDAWLGLRILFKLTAGMKVVTPANVMAKLNSVKNLDLDGIVPKWTPTAPGPTGFSKVSNTSMWYTGYKNGKPYLLVKHPVSLKNAFAGKF